jgi:hypothetical protein
MISCQLNGQDLNLYTINDSTFTIRGLCKNIYEVLVFNKENLTLEVALLENKFLKYLNNSEDVVNKKNNISVHGNILYNFNYQSFLDTPYLQNDLIQQFIQTRLNFTLKQQYPFSIFITHRNSNSSYFINATDISLQFKQTIMLDGQKKKLRKELDEILSNKKLHYSPEQLYQFELEESKKINTNTFIFKKYPEFKSDSLQSKFNSLFTEYKNKKDKLNQLDNWLNKTNHSQDIIEEKERQLREKILAKNKPSTDILLNDSLKNNLEKNRVAKNNKFDSTKTTIEQKIANKEKEFEKYRKELATVENKLKLFQKNTRDSLQYLMKKLNAVKDLNSLQDYIHLTNNDSNRLSTFQRLLLSIKQISIGRSWIDYSDLTVKNVSLNGLNIEVNPNKFYCAAAIGKVNYRFRDFVVKGGDAGSSQSLALVRFGYGQKEKNNLIFTYYTGRKALFNQTGIADSQAVKQVSGFSIESKIEINEHISLIAEYARSTYAGIENKMFQFKDKASEAWGLKLLSNHQKTNTKIEAYYRKIGEDFQSFTLNPTNSNQDAFAFKIKQSLFKRKLTLEASIRKNDFNSPLISPNFSNSTVFKSIQLTMQIPKYPYLSIGYYPSTQLLVGSNNFLYENQFNTLNAIASHSYTLVQLNMSTNAVFTKFYNKSTDSSFIYSNSKNLTINQSIFKAPFVFQTVGSYIEQAQFKQIAIEPIITYQYKNILSFTGSLKWNRIINQKTLWGSMVGINILLTKIGSIEMQYIKTYLPSFNNNLQSVNMGRLTFNREF